MNKFFVFLLFILGLFNSNKVYYNTFLNVSQNDNITYYNLIRQLCEIYPKNDETTNKILQTHKTSHINNDNDNDNDKDIDTISNYDETDKKPSYFGLLKQEINDAKYDYIDHVNYMNNELQIKYIKKLKYKLEFYDNLFLDKILDLRIQNKRSPLLHLILLSFFEIFIIPCYPINFIVPVYVIKKFLYLPKFDEDECI
ncbi:Plasmodium exported protein, unknown function [Plasmodium sp.]|nr:Plasmodium exported protein, unknown function [Plasmodium sp.]